MKKAVVYIHGKGGNAEEAEHYKTLFSECSVIGFDYLSQTPWDAKSEFYKYFEIIQNDFDSVIIIANSIGAFFAMTALSNMKIDKAYFISPVVNMEKLIKNMMKWANVSEDELRQAGEIETPFGEKLSWEYLSYVRTHPIEWNIPTHILYGDKDNLTSFKIISEFAEKTNATLTVMQNGEHWFHTDEQMAFLDDWIRQI